MINADYNVVLRVDNTKDLGWGEYRDSIRMTSNKPFEKNQLLVLDVVHMRMCLQFKEEFMLIGLLSYWLCYLGMSLRPCSDLQLMSSIACFLDVGLDVRSTRQMLTFISVGPDWPSQFQRSCTCCS